MSERAQKIGVFGGTFNPIHNGHLLIARRALDQFDLECMVFVPTGQTAYKEYAGTDMCRHRCNMIRLAIEGEPRFSISCDEIESSTVNYTYLTLQRMHGRCPDAQFYFLLGWDSLRDFPTWRHPELICKEAVILVAQRPVPDDQTSDASVPDEEHRIAQMAERFGGTFSLLDAPPLPISSSNIRSSVRNHADIRSMVPPAVADYILTNSLYLEEENSQPEGTHEI